MSDNKDRLGDLLHQKGQAIVISGIAIRTRQLTAGCTDHRTSCRLEIRSAQGTYFFWIEFT